LPPLGSRLDAHRPAGKRADPQYGAEDDAASFYSSAISQHTQTTSANGNGIGAVNGSGNIGGGAHDKLKGQTLGDGNGYRAPPPAHDGVHSSDLSLALEDLSVADDAQIHATVRNGYEEDFEDEGPLGHGIEHACRCVQQVVTRVHETASIADEVADRPATAASTTRNALSRCVEPLKPGRSADAPVLAVQQVVLQLARQHVCVPRCQPPRQDQAQGGDSAQGERARRDHSRV
jgi:hypothetical protein